MQAGDPIPDLTVASTHGAIRLRDLVGAPVVLYFYPRDATPGCTREACDFNAALDRFRAAGASVLGVSRDTLASHVRFGERQQLAFPLVADVDGDLCDAFDVIREKTLYGRKVVGIQRSTFLFDASGHLCALWRGVRVPGHVDAVLASLGDAA